MKLLPLEQLVNQLQPGVALPWGVRDASGKLLLARGRVIADAAMLTALIERGMFVDTKEINRVTTEAAANKGKEESLPTLWESLQARLSILLRTPSEAGFLEKIRESVDELDLIVERNPDLVIYLVLRHDHTRFAQYGVAHSLHVAALGGLTARRMGWPDAQRKNVIAAALTMNLSIIDLQGRLAAQTTPPTLEQRAEIDVHPQSSAHLLRLAGLNDAEWLAAVEQHHEQPGGSGYPNKIPSPTDISQLVRFVDSFTAKHSARAGRAQQPAQQAARDLYTQSKANPLAAVLIKEFGIYPPGCFVKLASGETAIVIKRGLSANAPIVAALTNRNGDVLTQPVSRDTAMPANAIASTIPDKAVMVRPNVEKLYDLRS